MTKYVTIVCYAILVTLVAGACALSPPVRVPAASEQPPADSPVILASVELRFPTQNNLSRRDIATYVAAADFPHYVSRPSRYQWIPYADAEPKVLDDAQRFWKSGRFESLWVDALDDPFENGVAAKRVIFNFAEQTDTVIPTANYPTLPPEYRRPPLGHARLYPPPEG